jgi:hypothetical protein
MLFLYKIYSVDLMCYVHISQVSTVTFALGVGCTPDAFVES